MERHEPHCSNHLGGGKKSALTFNYTIGLNSKIRTDTFLSSEITWAWGKVTALGLSGCAEIST